MNRKEGLSLEWDDLGSTEGYLGEIESSLGMIGVEQVKTAPLWIIAAMLTVMVTVMLLLLVSCGGYLFIVRPVQEQQRKQELIRREPWRQFERLSTNFQVELTNVCDLTCGYCPNKDMERSRTFMQDDVFDCILKDYVVPFKDINRFCTPTFIGHKDGEPLLNKKFPQQLKAVSDACSDMNIDI